MPAAVRIFDNAFVAVSRPFGSISMIKDIIVNLEHRIARDPVCESAIPIAEACNTHVAGAAFVHAPDLSGEVMPKILSQIVFRIGCGRMLISISASPGGPSPTAGRPLPFKRRIWPFRAPGGMLTSRVVPSGRIRDCLPPFTNLGLHGVLFHVQRRVRVHSQ
jgi:hypothetical protein